VSEIDEELVQELSRAAKIGESEGLRQAAKHVMEQAKDAFERFGPEHLMPVRLRHIANQLYCKANAVHPRVRE